MIVKKCRTVQASSEDMRIQVSSHYNFHLSDEKKETKTFISSYCVGYDTLDSYAKGPLFDFTKLQASIS